MTQIRNLSVVTLKVFDHEMGWEPMICFARCAAAAVHFSDSNFSAEKKKERKVSLLCLRFSFSGGDARSGRGHHEPHLGLPSRLLTELFRRGRFHVWVSG